MSLDTCCGDNRFEIIEKAKAGLLDSTDIDTSPEEMQVIDNFLFRCWQMGWLDEYDDTKKKPVLEISDDLTADLPFILEHYGIKHQIRKFNEEAFELTEALLLEQDNITEELSDVLVLLLQFIKHYKLDTDKIQHFIQTKIKRTCNRYGK